MKLFTSNKNCIVLDLILSFNLKLFSTVMLFFVLSFQDRGSEPSSPSVAENPLEAAVKARRKDKDEEQEGTYLCCVGYKLQFEPKIGLRNRGYICSVRLSKANQRETTFGSSYWKVQEIRIALQYRPVQP